MRLGAGIGVLSHHIRSLIKNPCSNRDDWQNRVRSLDADYSISIVDTLAKQAPIDRLRPLGLNDPVILSSNFTQGATSIP